MNSSEYYKLHPEKKIEHRKKDYERHSERYINQATEWNRNNKDARKKIRQKNQKLHPEYSKKWKENNPEKVTAEQIAYRNIELLEFCELCPDDNRQKAIERHHPDYDYPLIIVSCCKECHHYADKDRKEE